MGGKMAEEVSLHMEHAQLALDDGKLLLGNSGSRQGAIGRAWVAMIHAGWAMLLSVGEPVNTDDDVIAALEKRFGNNSWFYGYITGAKDVYLRVEFGAPVQAASLPANAAGAVSNADKFISMAHEFIITGDRRCWSVFE